ncbi:hypothetical protein Shyhy01_19760 [Streptomyces hygroscopicus subsp. hygroscopicus]|uniref:hypothetical protein n=1 Tax=Streptomyces sp. KHY 26 TaxID=3097359 RepID=UPI0024A2DDC6|nr:hypothetical protein [Streptomyces hygroscopicus]GLX49026.1 hypothetical protein Shyhy01_19760 [Streptomyces hygroscopicus subsp. hygroscopicus]
MPDQSSRHDRLRLARQRPRPDRIRRRSRASRGWQRFPWATTATALGVIAAIVGLFFNGIATYYGAKVSADQLKQSREDSDRQARQQAGRITFWIEDENEVGATRNIHVVNRSPDAVSEMSLAFSVELFGKNYRKPFVLTLDTLRPCAEAIYKPGDLGVYLGSGGAAKTELSGTGWGPWYLEFLDSNGKAWMRSHVGLVEIPAVSKDVAGFLSPSPKYPPQIKKVDNCSDGGQ